MTLSVGGAGLPAAFSEWRAGRAIEAQVTYRRPSRYLNEGVPDVERALALDGTTLLGSIKSGLLVEVVSRGTTIEEWAGRVRARVRRASERWVGAHDPLSAAIVTAVLSGDRTGLPDEVRMRLQAAGTYLDVTRTPCSVAPDDCAGQRRPGQSLRPSRPRRHHPAEGRRRQGLPDRPRRADHADHRRPRRAREDVCRRKTMNHDNHEGREGYEPRKARHR